MSQPHVTYAMQSGYAFHCSKPSLDSASSDMIVQSEANKAQYVGTELYEGNEYAKFRYTASNGAKRYAWQLLQNCKRIEQPYHSFDENDIDGMDRQFPHIYCDCSKLIHNPPEWMLRGLQQTATGYGAKLNSGLSILYCGKVYRIYITQYSNAGSAWFKVNGKKIYVS